MSSPPTDHGRRAAGTIRGEGSPGFCDFLRLLIDDANFFVAASDAFATRAVRLGEGGLSALSAGPSLAATGMGGLAPF